MEEFCSKHSFSFGKKNKESLSSISLLPLLSIIRKRTQASYRLATIYHPYFVLFWNSWPSCMEKFTHGRWGYAREFTSNLVFTSVVLLRVPWEDPEVCRPWLWSKALWFPPMIGLIWQNSNVVMQFRATRCTVKKSRVHALAPPNFSPKRGVRGPASLRPWRLKYIVWPLSSWNLD